MDTLSSSTTTSILLLVTTIILVLVIQRLLTNLRAPGPWGVPLLGYYPFIGTNLHVHLRDLSRKYGEVFRLNVLGQDYVHLGTVRAIREAHVTQADNFTKRQDDHVMLNTIFADGIVTSNGESWKYQRKFFVQCMRECGIGVGGKQLKGPVEDAVQYTLQYLRKSRGKVIDLMPLMVKACTDSVVRLFLGNNVSEKTVNRLNDCYIKATMPATNLNILMAGTLAKNVFFPRIRGYSDMMEGMKEMKTLLQEIIDEHRLTMDIDQPARDFLDHYVKEKLIREKNKDECVKYFTDEGILGTLIQVYGDGSSSVGIFVASFLHALTAHTQLQDDIHDEILSVVGSEQLPSLEDRLQLPLLNATIKELLRTTHFSAILPGLVCTKETSLFGVKIPKGCATVVNYWAANQDSAVYSEPDKFDPSRFLSETSKVKQPINFGIGRRACAGEGLTMTEFFLFMAAVLQNFLLLPIDEHESNNTKDKKQSLKSHNFLVMVVPRARGRFNSATGNA